jgi:hypothetical protein
VRHSPRTKATAASRLNEAASKKNTLKKPPRTSLAKKISEASKSRERTRNNTAETSEGNNSDDDHEITTTNNDEEDINSVEDAKSETSIKKGKKGKVDNKYINEMPFAIVPDWVVNKLKYALTKLFKNIKFITEKDQIAAIPGVMSYIFNCLNLKKNIPDQQLLRCRLWHSIEFWIYTEVNKMRTNKQTAFYTVAKGK